MKPCGIKDLITLALLKINAKFSGSWLGDAVSVWWLTSLKMKLFEIRIKISRDWNLAKFGTGSEELMYCFYIRLFCFQPVLVASLVTSDHGKFANT
jgi:hypothetical protein